jgi:hypothetical protein
VQDNLNGLLE